MRSCLLPTSVNIVVAVPVHEIRLAGPWIFTDASGVENRCTLPFPVDPTQSDGFAAGSVKRTFHAPSGIGTDTQLAIVVVSRHSVPDVTLNTQPLQKLNEAIRAAADNGTTETEFDVSANMANFNALTIDLGCAEKGRRNQILDVRLRIND